MTLPAPALPCYYFAAIYFFSNEINDMVNGSRHTLWMVLVSYVLLGVCVGGCAIVRKPKIVPESITTSRQLSRDGVAAMELGEIDLARTLLIKAVETSPTDIDARRHLAEVLWKQGNQREAVVHLEAAVHIDPRHAPTVVRSGEMLLEIGAVDSAAQRAEQAIALDAELAGAWALRGRVYHKQEEPARALADLQQALRYSPNMTEVLYEIAEVQYELGRPQRSLMTLHHLLDVCDCGEEPQRVLWLEGLAYGALQRHEDAVNSLLAASQRGEPQAELLYQLARAEQSAGDPAGASKTVKQALALNAGHQASQLLLAQLQSTRSDGNIIRR